MYKCCVMIDAILPLYSNSNKQNKKVSSVVELKFIVLFLPNIMIALSFLSLRLCTISQTRFGIKFFGLGLEESLSTWDFIICTIAKIFLTRTKRCNFRWQLCHISKTFIQEDTNYIFTVCFKGLKSVCNSNKKKTLSVARRDFKKCK